MLQGTEKSCCHIFSTRCKIWQTCDRHTHTHHSLNTLEMWQKNSEKCSVLFSSVWTHLGFVLKVLLEYSNQEAELVIPNSSIQKAAEWFGWETRKHEHKSWNVVVKHDFVFMHKIIRWCKAQSLIRASKVIWGSQACDMSTVLLWGEVESSSSGQLIRCQHEPI